MLWGLIPYYWLITNFFLFRLLRISNCDRSATDGVSYINVPFLDSGNVSEVGLGQNAKYYTVDMTVAYMNLLELWLPCAQDLHKIKPAKIPGWRREGLWRCHPRSFWQLMAARESRDPFLSEVKPRVDSPCPSNDPQPSASRQHRSDAIG